VQDRATFVAGKRAIGRAIAEGPLLGAHPVGCWADPEDITGAGVFLFSSGAEYTAEQLPTADGGLAAC
jgi:NAD(P)-dependent dehydrogenase (short-subunit alcohol dehydrogenase family)